MMTPLGTAIFQEEDDMAFLSSIFNTGACTVQPQAIKEGMGEQSVATKKKRRRRRPRREGEESKKRRLSAEQVKFLETCFVSERKLESGRKARLASEAGLDPQQVAVWFQNRRARWKSKQLEGEYNKLKLQLHDAVVEKCHLQAEMLKLKEQLAEAMAKITMLSGAAAASCETISGPSTSFSVDTTHCQPSAGDQAPLSYLHEHNYVNMLDWDYYFYGIWDN